MKQTNLVKKILILASNPTFQSPLNIDLEVRHIQLGLRGAKYSYQYRIEQRWAVQISDLRQSLLDEEPTILHFCGHGSQQGQLLFEDQNRVSKPVPGPALAELFSFFSKNLQCVLLNACYSAEQAKAISRHIPYVIGMRQRIGDSTALQFSRGFYDALGAGRNFEEAFHFGRTSVLLEGLEEADAPVLIKGRKSSSTGQHSKHDVSYEALTDLSRTGLLEIIDYYKEASQSSVKDPKAYFYLGICYLHLNMKDMAKQYFEKVITLDPSFSDAYYYKAICLLKQDSIRNIRKITADKIANLLNLCFELGEAKEKYFIFFAILNYGYYKSNGMRELKPNFIEALTSSKKAISEKGEFNRLIKILSFNDKYILKQLNLK